MANPPASDPQRDLNQRFNRLKNKIKTNQRQAAEPVRANLQRLGKISYLIRFAAKHNIALNAQIMKLSKRVTIKDLAQAATGAGWTEGQAISAMNCEFKVGYNTMRERLIVQHQELEPLDSISEPHLVEVCKQIRMWDVKLKNRTKELQNILPLE